MHIVHLVKDGKKYDKSTILKACKLMEQGDSNKSVAKKLKINLPAVQKWRREILSARSSKLAETRIRGQFDKKTISKVCVRLERGDKIRPLSREVGINRGSIQKWNRWFVKGNRPISGSQKNDDKITNDVKLKTRPVVVLTRDPKIDALCRKLNLNFPLARESNESSKFSLENQKNRLRRPFVPIRKVKYPIRTKLRIMKMIEEGASIAKLSQDFNIHGLILKSWVLNRYLLKRRFKRKLD